MWFRGCPSSTWLQGVLCRFVRIVMEVVKLRVLNAVAQEVYPVRLVVAWEQLNKTKQMFHAKYVVDREVVCARIAAEQAQACARNVMVWALFQIKI